MAISSELIKQLRQKTSAGFTACKQALDETNGDLTAAEEYLRKKGLMDAAKKSNRIAADGLVSCYVTDDLKKASIVEVNTETDFVAKNEKFQSFVKSITDLALDVEQSQLLDASFKNSGHSVRDELSFMISVIGENIQFKRSQHLSVNNGVIGTYTHNAVVPGSHMGKIGVLVCLENGDDNFDTDIVKNFGKKLAMHVAASSPRFLSIESVPEEVLEKEKDIAKEQAISLGKTTDVVTKIAEGRVKRYYEEAVMLEQLYFEDSKLTVKQVLNKFNKDNNTSLKITNFVRYMLGEN